MQHPRLAVASVATADAIASAGAASAGAYVSVDSIVSCASCQLGFLNGLELGRFDLGNFTTHLFGKAGAAALDLTQQCIATPLGTGNQTIEALDFVEVAGNGLRNHVVHCQTDRC